MAIDKLPKNIPDIMTKKVEGAIKVGENETKEARLISLSNSVWKEALNPKLTQADAARGVAKIMGNIRDDGGKSYGFKTVEEANAYNGDDKEQVDASLDVIATASYLAIANAPATEVVDITTNLGRGSARGVRNELPAGMVGLENKMVAVLVPDPEVQRNLSKIDLRRSRTKYDDSQQKADLAEKVINTARELNGEEDVWAEVVATYLYAEARGLEDVKVMPDSVSEKPENAGGTSPEEDYFRDLAEYQRERGKLEHEVAEVSLTEWVDAQISITAPRERAPQMWEYSPPPWMNGESRKSWRQLLQLADGMLGGTYQKQKDGGYKTSLEMVKKNSMALMELPEEDFKFVQEHEILNGSGVAHEIFQELLMPQVTKAIINGKEVSTTTFVFRHKTGRDGERQYISEVNQFADNPATYKRELAERLVERKVVGNIEAAKLSVALTMDAFEVGGVFSGADILRKLSWESDAVRLAQRPIEKFNAKIGEMWGGTWNNYCKAVTQGNAKEAMKLAEKMGIMPKLLAGSFLDVKMQDGKSWAQKMYDGEQIKMSSSSGDLYFGWRKDSLNAACEILMYITKEKPLQFKSFDEPDNIISDWVASLYNDVKALRENGVSLLTVEAIAGAFGGSVGVWPFEGPYFRISAVNDPKRQVNYFSIGTEVARQLGLPDVDEKKFLEFFGVDRKYFVDLNNKMTDYSVILNPNASASYKAEMYTKGDLLKKRP